MIPANQLRTGNFVNCPSKNETMCEVHTINRFGNDISLTDNPHGVKFDAKIEDIEPIPLTQDLLLLFGFTCDDEDGETWRIADEPLFEIHSTITAEFHHIWDASYTEAPIDNLHQLQNLFFALTGKELQYHNL
jgi:hypothetical protein